MFRFCKHKQHIALEQDDNQKMEKSIPKLKNQPNISLQIILSLSIIIGVLLAFSTFIKHSNDNYMIPLKSLNKYFFLLQDNLQKSVNSNLQFIQQLPSDIQNHKQNMIKSRNDETQILQNVQQKNNKNKKNIKNSEEKETQIEKNQQFGKIKEHNLNQQKKNFI